MASLSPKGGGDEHPHPSIDSVGKDLASPSPLNPDQPFVNVSLASNLQDGTEGGSGATTDNAAASAVSAEVAMLASSIEANSTRLEAVENENRESVSAACARLTELQDLEQRVKRDLIRVEGLPAIIERDQDELKDMVASRDAFIAQLRDLRHEQGRDEGQEEQEGQEGQEGQEDSSRLKITNFSRLLALEPPRDAMQPLAMPSGPTSSVEALEASAPSSVKAHRELTSFHSEIATGEGDIPGEPPSKAVEMARTSGLSFPRLALSSPAAGAGTGASSSLAPQTPSSARRSRSLSRTNSGRALELSKGRYLNVDEARTESAAIKAKLVKALEEKEDLIKFSTQLQLLEGTLSKMQAQATRKEDVLAALFEQLSDAVDVAREESIAAQTALKTALHTGELRPDEDDAEWRAALKRAEAEREMAAASVIAAVGTGSPVAAGIGMGIGGDGNGGGGASVDALSPKTVVSDILPSEIATGTTADQGLPRHADGAAGTGGTIARVPSGQEPLSAQEIPLDDDIPSTPPIEKFVSTRKAESATAGSAAREPASLATPAPEPTAASTAAVPSTVIPGLAGTATAASIPLATAVAKGPLQTPVVKGPLTALLPQMQMQTQSQTQTQAQTTQQSQVPTTAPPPVQAPLPVVTATPAPSHPPHPHPDLQIDTRQVNREVPVEPVQQQQHQPHHPPPGEAALAHETALDRCMNKWCVLQ